MNQSPSPQSIGFADRDAKLAQALSAANAVFLVAGPGEGAVAASKAALGPGAAEVDLGGFGQGDDSAAVFAIRRAAQDGAPLVLSGLGAGDPGSPPVQAAFEAIQQLARRGVKSVIVSRDPLESYGLGQRATSELRVVGGAIASALSQRRAHKQDLPQTPSGPKAGQP